MKLKSKMLAIMLTAVTLFSLSACGKKAISAEKYQKIMVDAGMTVEIGEDMQEGVKSYYLASDLTRLSYLEFYESEAAAKAQFDEAVKEMRSMEAEINATDDGVAAHFEVVVSEASDINKLTASMGSEEAGFGFDKVIIIQVDDMLLLVHSYAAVADGTKAVDELVDKFGY